MTTGLWASRIRLFFGYEFRGAVARRKVLALMVSTMLLDTVPYYAQAVKAPNLIPPTYHLLMGGGSIPPVNLHPTVHSDIHSGRRDVINVRDGHSRTATI